MNIVDANVLIYAVNEDSARHDTARRWLDGAIGSGAAVGLPWLVLIAFIRLTTKPGLLPAPFNADAALARVRHWLGPANVVVPEPTERHVDVLAGLLADTGTGGNLVSDAHVAALAVEHGGAVVTFDHDFGRFNGLRWHEPEPPPARRATRRR